VLVDQQHQVILVEELDSDEWLESLHGHLESLNDEVDEVIRFEARLQ